MPSNEQLALDLFGEALISKVRDTQIQLWDKTLAGTVNHRNYKQVYTKLSKLFNAEQLSTLENLIPWIVDNTIADILGMLQEKHREIDIIIRVNGEVAQSLYAVSDLLNSELWGEDGWIARFSKQRPTDEKYFAEDTSSK